MSKKEFSNLPVRTQNLYNMLNNLIVTLCALNNDEIKTAAASSTGLHGVSDFKKLKGKIIISDRIKAEINGETVPVSEISDAFSGISTASLPEPEPYSPEISAGEYESKFNDCLRFVYGGYDLFSLNLPCINCIVLIRDASEEKLSVLPRGMLPGANETVLMQLTVDSGYNCSEKPAAPAVSLPQLTDANKDFLNKLGVDLNGMPSDEHGFLPAADEPAYLLTETCNNSGIAIPEGIDFRTWPETVVEKALEVADNRSAIMRFCRLETVEDADEMLNDDGWHKPFEPGLKPNKDLVEIGGIIKDESVCSLTSPTRLDALAASELQKSILVSFGLTYKEADISAKSAAVLINVLLQRSAAGLAGIPTLRYLDETKKDPAPDMSGWSTRKAESIKENLPVYQMFAAEKDEDLSFLLSRLKEKAETRR